MAFVTVDDDSIVFEGVFVDKRTGRRGLDIERWATEALPLTKDRGHYHDARNSIGRKYEIKAAQFRDEAGRPGRFWFRYGQQAAMDDCDMYLLVVYDVTHRVKANGTTHVEEYRIIDYTRKPMLGLDTVVPEERFNLVRHDTLGKVEVASVPWPEFRNLDEELLHTVPEPDA